MSALHTNVTESHGEANGGESSIISLLIVLAKHKKLIVGLPLLAAMVAVAVSLAMSDVYQANTKLLPPQQGQSGAAALLSQLGGAGGIAAGVAGIKNPNDLYIGMLRSRTIADNLIKQFDLKKVYGTDSQEKARKRLEDNTVISTGKDGLIEIEVSDNNKKAVAPMANAYVQELLRLTKVLAVSEASQRRVFFEQQLEISKDRLAAAEMRLKAALDTHGVISVDSESRAIVATIATLRAQISAKEIQLNSMSAFLTTGNPAYQRAQEELNSLKNELSKLENGRPSTDTQAQGTEKSTAGLENIKVLRDVKYYQMLYELLSKQYELARLDEAKDASIIQVLDTAQEPERKYKPKRAIIVVLSFGLGVVAAIALAFILEIRQKILNVPSKRAEWEILKGYLRFR